MRRDAGRFVVLAAPRSGSNMLCTLLGTHPDIVCHHELYNPAGSFYALDYRDSEFSLGSQAFRDARPLAFLRRLWTAHPDAACVGFKMTHYQRPAVFQHLLDDAGVKKIVLKRRNPVRCHVSRLIAQRRNLWELYDGRSLDPVQVEVDPDELEADIAFNRAYYAGIHARLTATGQTYCPVVYETLESPDTHAHLLDFLEQPHRPLRAGSTRQNPQPLRQLIGNFTQLVTHFNHNDDLRVALTSEP